MTGHHDLTTSARVPSQASDPALAAVAPVEGDWLSTISPRPVSVCLSVSCCLLSSFCLYDFYMLSLS